MQFTQHKELDITDFKEKGVQLAKAIENTVADTQRYILTTLPDTLVMTQNQFDDLVKVSNMPELYETKDRMYITKLNVMEIRIKT